MAETVFAAAGINEYTFEQSKHLLLRFVHNGQWRKVVISTTPRTDHTDRIRQDIHRILRTA